MNHSLIAILLGLACVAPAADHGTSPGMTSEDQRRIGLAELPAPAREAIQREAMGTTLGDITRTTVDGRVVYDVLLKQEGGDRRVQVAADGSILREPARGGETGAAGKTWNETKAASNRAWEAAKDTSQEAWNGTKEVTAGAWERGRQALDSDGLTLANVPPAVRAALERETAGQEITDIDVDAKNGTVFFVAEVRVPEARNRVVKVALDGTVLADSP